MGTTAEGAQGVEATDMEGESEMTIMNFIFYLKADPVIHNTDASVIAVRLGVSGFNPINTTATPDLLNFGGPLPEEVAEAALAASMFGWDTPAAEAAIAHAEEVMGCVQYAKNLVLGDATK